MHTSPHIFTFLNLFMFNRKELERVQAEQQKAWDLRLEKEDELFQRHEQQKVSNKHRNTSFLFKKKMFEDTIIKIKN